MFEFDFKFISVHGITDGTTCRVEISVTFYTSESTC